MQKTRAKKCSKPLEPEESLCCCEYIDRNGEKSHLVACCCDCQDLDDACDRWFKCKSLQPGTLEHVTATVSDRLRIPWFAGAKKVDISILPPLLLLPVFLHIAALHILFTAIVLVSLPILVLWYYYLTHRKKGQTLFFLSLGLFSLGYMYYTFVSVVVPRGNIGTLQLIFITGGLLLTLIALAQAKEGPGYLVKKNSGFLPPSKEAATWSSNNKESNGTSRLVMENWCNVCKLERPPRTGHCRICDACVSRLDHHCVWINSCVGEQNHRAFIMTLLLFLFTSVYGIYLTLETVCIGSSPLIALIYCPGVYSDYSSAFSFACVWYCAIVTAGMGHLCIIQLINISYNVTEREARIALREEIGRKYLWGLIVDTGQYNHGFLKNWKEFLTMKSPQSRHKVEDLI
ncbi:palmitoyltransferase ZDHHC23 isoform X1 [Protopterus annectens]|uniref:palmitoyltransferase ZDHHC23 isoform X1 n=1 Tax=Protopterus annectens TaxID=7888 RepID=UPI001CFC2100|nr:palmitoyltransferase ZDHHC23 isoform X1 [Protopterus annectens]XP_043929088.1 palmitoyltransferase ZDHHC23 isoform X1 [Protopterus annectens]